MNSRQISLLAAFAAAKVEYAVVGGVAVNAHGYVRATNDLDIFIRPTEENARAAFNALLALGVPVEGLKPGDLLDDQENIRFGPRRTTSTSSRLSERCRSIRSGGTGLRQRWTGSRSHLSRSWT